MRSSFGYCRSCNAQIIWARTKAGKAIPLDFATVSEPERHSLSLHFDPAAGHISHFATCPSAGEHRKRGA